MSSFPPPPRRCCLRLDKNTTWGLSSAGGGQVLGQAANEGPRYQLLKAGEATSAGGDGTISGPIIFG